MRCPARVLATVTFAVALTSGQHAAASPEQSSAHHGGHVLEYVCHGKHYKPHRILVACGDGNAYANHLQWTTWTRHKAHAHGIWVQNNCKPDCAQGEFKHYPVRLRLSQVTKRGHDKIFGRVVGVFPHRAPPYPAYKHHRVVVMNHGKPAP